MDSPDDDVPTSALLHVPAWFWGKAPARFLEEAGFEARPVDRATSTWRLITQERYRNQRPPLVTLEHLAGPGHGQPQFGQMTGSASGPDMDYLHDAGLIQAELKKRRDRAELTGAPVDLFGFWTLQTLVMPRAQLPEAVRIAFEGLTDIRLAEDNSVRPFEHAGVHVVRRSPALLHRVKMVSILLRMEHDERLRVGDLKHLNQPGQRGDRLFGASEQLYDGTYVLDAYLGPLWGALTPAIWSLATHREIGVIAYSLGQPASGTQGDATELLQLLPVKAPLMTVRTPKPGPHAATDALNWWVAQLDEMFSVVSDPAVFSDAGGVYSAPRQMQAVLTAEQLFRRVASLQVSHRDLNARRVLLFTVLDTLTRLKGGDLGKLFNLSSARKTLEHLKEAIPTEAAEILLPAAERAVKALEGVQDGFYLRRQLGTADVELAGGGGRTDRLAPEKAAAEYLTLLRNATHGHGTNKSARVDRTNALLAHHTGHLPDDLDLLGYLYLLDVLARPRELRRRLYSEGR